MEDPEPVIIDNGSGSCKAGFCTDVAPRMNVTSIVGIPRFTKDSKEYYVENESSKQTRQEILSLRYPIESGVIIDWESMQRIWQHIFEDLSCTNENPVVLTDSVTSPKPQREKMAEIFFETFNLSNALTIQNQAILALFPYNKITGIVLDSGEGVTQLVAVYEGYYIKGTATRLDIEGRKLTQYMMQLLNSKGGYYSFEDAKFLKENACKLSLNYEKEKSSRERRRYRLPDGRVIHLGEESYQVPEALFTPSLVGMESAGIHENIRRELSNNIILSGGSTLFPNFPERLASELNKILPFASPKCRVFATPERKYSVWIGAVIISTLYSTFQQVWISPYEYSEYGPNIVHRKGISVEYGLFSYFVYFSNKWCTFMKQNFFVVTYKTDLSH